MVLYQCSNSGTKSGGHENRGLSVRTRDYTPLVVVPSPRSEATSRTAKVKYVQVAAKALTCNNTRRSTRSFRVICMQEEATGPNLSCELRGRQRYTLGAEISTAYRKGICVFAFEWEQTYVRSKPVSDKHFLSVLPICECFGSAPCSSHAVSWSPAHSFAGRVLFKHRGLLPGPVQLHDSRTGPGPDVRSKSKRVICKGRLAL